MDILGYIGYAALIALAAIWILGIRVKLDAGAHTILGALFFAVGAVVLELSGADKLHSLWVIVAGFLFPVVMAYVAAHTPLLFSPFRLLATGFASIVRVGIPAHRIQVAQDAGLKASIDEWASKNEGGRKE